MYITIIYFVVCIVFFTLITCNVIKAINNDYENNKNK